MMGGGRHVTGFRRHAFQADRFQLRFDPEIILPAPTPVSRPSPERRLLLAILEDALHVLRIEAVVGEPRARERRSQLVRETVDWFAADDDAWPFSFRSVCAALDLDASWIRRQLARGRAGRVAGRRVGVS